jgi:cyclic pyranopterin phosphate synthase
MPLLDYCLERGYELRFIELMRMGHLASDSNAFLQQFVSLQQLLSLIGEHYEYLQADAPVDATAVRYEIPGQGHFGVIANESVPFCRTCSRLRLSSTGWLHGCLSSSNRHYVGDLLDKPRHQALPALQRLLVKALGDKQEVAFSGGATIMKIIGGCTRSVAALGSCYKDDPGMSWRGSCIPRPFAGFPSPASGGKDA